MSEEALRLQVLPVGSRGRRSSGWYGMWCLVATEAAIFAYLLFSYFYLASQATGAWPPDGAPPLRLAGPNTLVLLLSSVALFWAERTGARRDQRGRLLLGLAVALGLGLAFVAVQVLEWRRQTFSLRTGTYGSTYFILTGFHLAHVVIGLVLLLALLVWAWRGYFDRNRHAALTIGAIYWHFVDAVWLVVFASIYLTPRLR